MPVVGSGGASDDETSRVLGERVRMLSRWVEVSSSMLRLTREDEVRQLLADYLRSELGAAHVGFVPGALAGHEREGHEVLRMAGCDEAVEVRVGSTPWSNDRREMACKAAQMTDACLAGIARLREAQRQSLTDPLTGLYNRRSLDRMLEREVLLAGRHRTPLTVVVIDVDRFKEVNDRLGHDVGDELLRLIASVLTGTLRRSDLAFRMGGDEFVVLLPQTTTGSALAAMEKVRRNVADVDLSLARMSGMVPTLSIGLAEYWRGAKGSELLRAADEALYTAKRESRNCIRAYRAAA